MPNLLCLSLCVGLSYSGHSVVLTLWADQASRSDLDGCEGQIMQVTCVRVGDYNGCSLSAVTRSQVGGVTVGGLCSGTAVLPACATPSEACNKITRLLHSCACVFEMINRPGLTDVLFLFEFPYTSNLSAVIRHQQPDLACMCMLQVTLNPNGDEADALRHWWDSEGRGSTLSPLGQAADTAGAAGGAGQRQNKLQFLSDVVVSCD